MFEIIFRLLFSSAKIFSCARTGAQTNAQRTSFRLAFVPHITFPFVHSFIHLVWLLPFLHPLRILSIVRCICCMCGEKRSLLYHQHWLWMACAVCARATKDCFFDKILANGKCLNNKFDHLFWYSYGNSMIIYFKSEHIMNLLLIFIPLETRFAAKKYQRIGVTIACEWQCYHRWPTSLCQHDTTIPRDDFATILHRINNFHRIASFFLLCGPI